MDSLGPRVHLSESKMHGLLKEENQSAYTFLSFMIPGGNLMSLFLKVMFGIHDLCSLLRLRLSKVGKCQFYLIVEKQVCGLECGI